MATYTVQRFCNERRVISLSVELIGHLQNLAWTEFHAETTSFTSVLNNINNGRWRQFFIPIKGFSPHLHGHEPISLNLFLCINSIIPGIPTHSLFCKGRNLSLPLCKGELRGDFICNKPFDRAVCQLLFWKHLNNSGHSDSFPLSQREES